jgi:hypothetical protein
MFYWACCYFLVVFTHQRTDPLIGLARNLIAIKELKSCGGMRLISQQIDSDLQRQLLRILSDSPMYTAGPA